MTKLMRLTVAVLGALLMVMPSTADASEKTFWVGSDPDSKVVWTCTNTDRDNWSLKCGGKDYGRYETVTSNGEFIELQAKGVMQFDRVRLYKDRLSMNEAGSRTRWITMATGKFED